MRIVHLCNQVLDGGGTATAVLRLHKSLEAIGVESVVLVSPFRRHKPSEKIYPIIDIQKASRWVYFYYWLVYTWNKFVSRSAGRLFDNWVSVPFGCGVPASSLLRLQPDVVHIHSIQDAEISMSELRKTNVPIVWTMHDLAIAQGVCHLPNTNWLSVVLDRLILRWKQGYLANMNIGFICPSRLMYRYLEKAYPGQLCSSKIRIIPNIVRLEDSLGAPDGISIDTSEEKSFSLLFGASGFLSDPNKGWGQVRKIIRARNQGLLDCGLTVFGDDNYHPRKSDKVNSLGKLVKPWHSDLGLSSHSLFLAFSRFESFGILAMEAALHGIPIVCFSGTGTADLVLEFSLGKVLPEKITDSDFIMEMRRCLMFKRLSKEKRIRLARFLGPGLNAEKTLSLYQDVLKGIESNTTNTMNY